LEDGEGKIVVLMLENRNGVGRMEIEKGKSGVHQQSAVHLGDLVLMVRIEQLMLGLVLDAV
jgi:hypothetical protein